MGVLVGAPLPFALQHDVVAVELGVICLLEDGPRPDRDQRAAAGGGDVESLVGAAIDSRSAELADVSTGAMRSVDRELVAVKADPSQRPQRPPDRSGNDPVAARRGEPATLGATVPAQVMPAGGRDPAGDDAPDGPARAELFGPDREAQRPSRREAQVESDRLYRGGDLLLGSDPGFDEPEPASPVTCPFRGNRLSTADRSSGRPCKKQSRRQKGDGSGKAGRGLPNDV